MARLVDEIAAEVQTDFALLSAAQGDRVGYAETQTYAASAPGCIAMMCGTKYANLVVRLERWDGRPAEADPLWEDCDEVPWEPVAEAGPLLVFGFDPAEGDGLDVTDLGRSRVQVLASGRHRYTYGDFVEGLPPERWLLRLWPDPDAGDALAGPPRRVAGPLPFMWRRNSWGAAFQGWSLAGWSSYLLGVEAFRVLAQAVAFIGQPFHPNELLPKLGPWGMQRDRAGAYDWSSPAIGHGWAVDIRQMQPEIGVKLEALARAAKLPGIETFGDALTALERLGLLARLDGGRIVPNPAPAPVWELVPLSPEARAGLETQALRAEFSSFEGDIEHVVRWCDGELITTPRTIATRLAIHPDDVRGAMRLLRSTRRDVSLDPEGPTDPDREVTIRTGVAGDPSG